MSGLRRKIDAALARFAKQKAIENGNLTEACRKAQEKLRAVQAERIRTFVEHFGTHERQVAVLGDPVGTGKTCVSLFIARFLMEDHGYEHVLVVAPNKTVAAKWLDEAQEKFCGLGDHLARKPDHFSWAKKSGELRVVTRSNLPDNARASPNPSKTLIIVDEAHRGTQLEGGAFNAKLRCVAKGSRVLLVTATPMQLSASGIVTMLRVGRAECDADSDLELITAYGQALKALLESTHGDNLAEGRGITDGSRKHAHVAATRRAMALAAFERVQLGKPYDREAAGIPALPEFTRHEIGLDARFKTAYHVASCIPELVLAKRGDMFNRMLVSSAEAFWASQVGSAFDEHEKVDAFKSSLKERLTEHSKVHATVEWIRKRPATNHVIVFCIFKATQSGLYGKLKSAFPGARVEAPDDADELRRERNGWRTDDLFRTPALDPGARVILVVRDNLSESIDLDGGQPAVVHHDLSWNPVRLQQRMGRVCRASSGFQRIDPEDIYVPVMPVEIDRRLASTAAARATHADVLLPRSHDDLSRDEGAHDTMWALPQELLQIVLGV